jgi:hypothetical protein
MENAYANASEVLSGDSNLGMIVEEIPRPGEAYSKYETNDVEQQHDK